MNIIVERLAKRTAAAALGAALLASTAGCVWEPCSSGCSGNVVDRSDSWSKGGRKYWITVKEDGSGNRDKGRVSKETYDACTVGKRWPDCKNPGGAR